MLVRGALNGSQLWRGGVRCHVKSRHVTGGPQRDERSLPQSLVPHAHLCSVACLGNDDGGEVRLVRITQVMRHGVTGETTMVRAKLTMIRVDVSRDARFVTPGRPEGCPKEPCCHAFPLHQFFRLHSTTTASFASKLFVDMLC